VEDALRVRAAYQVYISVVNGIAKDKEIIKSRTLYNEVYQQDQVIMSLYHLHYYTIWSAAHHIAKSNIKCPNLLAYLKKLVMLHGLSELVKDSQTLYDSGYFKAGAGAAITEGIKGLTAELRPQFIPLVEAFDIPDNTLNSAVGNSYGDIYEDYMNLAKRSRLNRNNNDYIPDYLKSTLFPVILNQGPKL
jgi:hypothetical protein